MIAQLTGTALHKMTDSVILDVNGVGYKVHTSLDTLTSLNEGSEVSLWTYLAVRENALDLYGFQSEEELNFFELLLGISGIGPKSALGVLSVAPVETLRSAVASGDTTYLTKVSGIGSKTAQKIVLELKDKIGALESESGGAARQEESDAIDALKALGYSHSEARNALKKLDESITGTQERIRAALKILGS